MNNPPSAPPAVDEAQNCEFLYTPLDVAQAEIWRRWQDADLRKAVVSFLDGQVPAYLGDSPCALLWRHIPSPNLEFAEFVKMAGQVNLAPICPNYCEDKFVPANPDKYYLARMYFHIGWGRNGGHKIRAVNVLNLTAAQGKRFDQIETIWGESFVAFHYRLVRQLFPSIACEGFTSAWIWRSAPIDSYTRLFALLTCFGVLFENYSLSNHEADFTRTVVLPAFHATGARFGVKPLIVRLMPPETAYDLYWYCYPASLKPIVDASLRGEVPHRLAGRSPSMNAASRPMEGERPREPVLPTIADPRCGK